MDYVLVFRTIEKVIGFLITENENLPQTNGFKKTFETIPSIPLILHCRTTQQAIWQNKELDEASVTELNDVALYVDIEAFKKEGIVI